MPALFETTTIKDLTLANRFVRSSTSEGMAEENGACSRQLSDFTVQLAEGGVGLIITGHAYVSRDGQTVYRQIGIYDDELIPGLAAMAEAVHEAGGKLAVQLGHAGCHADPDLTGRTVIGPSTMKGDGMPNCREMTGEDCRMVVEAFGKAAARARQAGFDGVQIRAAHGYLLSQFLSPFYNKRKDQYGGSLENRARLLLEVVQSVRANGGDGFPVIVKINSEDFVSGGLTLDEMLQVASLLETAGIDAIELSGGTRYSGDYTPVRLGRFDTENMEVYYRDAARKFKKISRLPLMLVGGIRSYSVAERIVTEGIADYVSMCRPLIREPALINRWKSGDISKSKCLSDNLCFRRGGAPRPLECAAEKRRGEA